MGTKPIASTIAPATPGTAAPQRLTPAHRGATAKSSPNGARLQALANIATRRRVGTSKTNRRLPEPSAHLGKSLQAHDDSAC